LTRDNPLPASQAELNALRSAKQAAESGAVRQLQSDLSFRDQELERISRELETSRGALRAAQAASPGAAAAAAAHGSPCAGRPAAAAGGRGAAAPPTPFDAIDSAFGRVADSRRDGAEGRSACAPLAFGHDSPPLFGSGKGPPRTPALASGARKPSRLSGGRGSGGLPPQLHSPLQPWQAAEAPSGTPPVDRTLAPDETEDERGDGSDRFGGVHAAAAAAARSPSLSAAPSPPAPGAAAPMQIDAAQDAAALLQQQAPPPAAPRLPSLLLPLLLRPCGPLQRLLQLCGSAEHRVAPSRHWGAGAAALPTAEGLLEALSQLTAGDEHAPAMLLALEPFLAHASGASPGRVPSSAREPSPLHAAALHARGGGAAHAAAAAAGGGGVAEGVRRAALRAALRVLCILFGSSDECRAAALQAMSGGAASAELQRRGGQSSAAADGAGDVDMLSAGGEGPVASGVPEWVAALGAPQTLGALLALVEAETRALAAASQQRHSREGERRGGASAAEAGAASSSSDARGAVSVLLPAVRALSLLLWAEPTKAAEACLPIFRRWLGEALEPADAGDAESSGGTAEGRGRAPAACVFWTLLGEPTPAPLQLAALSLLREVLRSEDAFSVLVRPTQLGPRASPVSRLAVLLCAAQLGQHHHHDGAEAGERRDAAAAWAGSSALGGGPGPHGDEESDDEEAPRWHGAAGALPWEAVRPEARLSCAAIRLFARLSVLHPGAAQQLLQPALDLALPVRLVSLLQAQAHTLQLGGGSGALELSIVEDALLLLLELARCAGGSLAGLCVRLLSRAPPPQECRYVGGARGRLVDLRPLRRDGAARAQRAPPQPLAARPARKDATERHQARGGGARARAVAAWVIEREGRPCRLRGWPGALARVLSVCAWSATATVEPTCAQSLPLLLRGLHIHCTVSAIGGHAKRQGCKVVLIACLSILFINIKCCGFCVLCVVCATSAHALSGTSSSPMPPCLRARAPTTICSSICTHGRREGEGEGCASRTRVNSSSDFVLRVACSCRCTNPKSKSACGLFLLRLLLGGS